LVIATSALVLVAQCWPKWTGAQRLFLSLALSKTAGDQDDMGQIIVPGTPAGVRS
jgi:hypothetical protein